MRLLLEDSRGNYGIMSIKNDNTNNHNRKNKNEK